MRNHPFRLLAVALLAVFTLIAAGCGDDDDTDAEQPTSEAPADDAAADDAAADDAAGDDAAGDDAAADDAAGDDAAADDAAADDAAADDAAADDAAGDDAAGDDAAADDAAADDGAGDDGAGDGAAIVEGELVGVFGVTAGDCAGDTVTGSYFRMVQVGGTLEAGPFMANPDSPCADPSYIALTPGTDGGLITGTFQPAPDPAFDENGNGLADAIVMPATFLGADFAAATADPDTQTGETVVAPVIVMIEGELSGDLSAFGAFYGGEVFNQGAPKPDGTLPGLSAGPTGTIDPATGDYMIEWTSQIIGGPFNDFTGVWHLEGTFTG